MIIGLYPKWKLKKDAEELQRSAYVMNFVNC